MLFNSYEYILVFLPVTVLVFLMLGRRSQSWALGWLIVASVVFYAYWRPFNLAIIGPSLAVNWLFARRLLALAGDESRNAARRWTLTLGIAFNVCLLGYFKYANFGVTVANDLMGANFVLHTIILPLGISFITFQKIAFLIDVAGGRIKGFTLRDFLLFVMFFPQLIAGPIVHFGETMPQFHRATCRFDAMLYATGITLFAFGLFKKVVLADGVAEHVTPVFAYAAAGGDATMVQSWLAAVGFTLQIYFDFSGYSDMACGAALLFGVRLPMNFYSPLKASSIIEFWLHWHITLTRFLTAYIFNPITLALTRRRAMRRQRMLGARFSDLGAFLQTLAFPTLTTMLISGLWHGAGYTFLVWGALHGVYIVINHAWRQYGPRPADPAGRSSRVAVGAGFVLTFLAVVVAMVIFRAPTIAAAGNILLGMTGLNGLGLPEKIAGLIQMPGLGPMLLGEGAVDPVSFATASAYVTGLLAIALLMPNSLQMLAAEVPALHLPKTPGRIAGMGPVIAWRPNLRWMVFIAVIAAIAMIRLTGKSEFLYWQF
ncbi:MAG TPA: MBOAT family O-acyltransferase [Amaricoccus sp.]|jgi:alginate O-acetyltransferase complex protein AlgI|uniref:MBOAT family O-acyltransferase n=1 Tax=Amaricoccus sp. TaxID=1872485 RepID=UPI002C0467A4|nr:MBOAT family O-acyltransferase [Amaricoccus sp.]HMR51710.1 MBOAT family O-acyltransferase [Amaricoccus sp.]HMT98594.1 MBOAT family O-acyltransferase [Amaricoccus sp.]